MKSKTVLLSAAMFAVAIGAIPVEAQEENLFVLDVENDGSIASYGDSGAAGEGGVLDLDSNRTFRKPLASGDVFEGRTVMTFDLSGFNADDLISAKLTGYGAGGSENFTPDSVTAKLYAYSGDGHVTPMDFNAEGQVVGDYTFTGLDNDPLNPTNFNPFEIDVTDSVRSVLNDGGEFMEFRFQTDINDVYFTAGEVGGGLFDGNFAGPQLALAVVPEPASFALMGLGGLALAGHRRRKRKRQAS